MINQLIKQALQAKQSTANYDPILDYRNIKTSIEEFEAEIGLSNRTSESLEQMSGLKAVLADNIFYQISAEVMNVGNEDLATTLTHLKQYFHVSREETEYVINRFKVKIDESKSSKFFNPIALFDETEYHNFHNTIYNLVNEIKTAPSRMKVIIDADDEEHYVVGTYWRNVIKTLNTHCYLLRVDGNMRDSGIGYLNHANGPDHLIGWSIKVDLSKFTYGKQGKDKGLPHELSKKDVYRVLDAALIALKDTEVLITDLDKHAERCVAKIKSLKIKDPKIEAMAINNQEQLPKFISDYVTKYLKVMGNHTVKLAFNSIKELD